MTMSMGISMLGVNSMGEVNTDPRPKTIRAPMQMMTDTIRRRASLVKLIETTPSPYSSAGSAVPLSPEEDASSPALVEEDASSALLEEPSSPALLEAAPS